MFELIPSDSYTITNRDFGVSQGVLTKVPSWNTGYGTTGAIAVQAPSMSSFVRYLQKHMAEPKRGKDSARVVRKGDDFHFFETYEETMDVFQHRPHEIRIFEENLMQLRSEADNGNDVFFDVTGDFVDVGRFLDGVPETCGNMYLGNPRGFFATILINMAATCHFDQRALQARSRRILRLVDWLESQSIRTKILAFKSNQCMYAEIVVKRFQDSFSIDDLAIVSCPDFFRRLLFRCAEYSDTWNSFYGTSTLLYEGRLNAAPQSDAAQITILSETNESIEKTEKNFDKAEAELEKKLLDNDVPISLHV